MEEITEELELEEIFRKVIDDRELFSWMINHRKVKSVLDEAAAWAAREFKHDKEDMRQELDMKLYKSLERIHNPRALKGWCYSVIGNHCRDLFKKTGKEITCGDETELDFLENERKGRRLLPQNSTDLTLEQEQQLRDAVSIAVAPYPDELVQGFVHGKTIREIALETCLTKST